MEGWMNLFLAGVFGGVLKIATLEGFSDSSGNHYHLTSHLSEEKGF